MSRTSGRKKFSRTATGSVLKNFFSHTYMIKDIRLLGISRSRPVTSISHSNQIHRCSLIRLHRIPFQMNRGQGLFRHSWCSYDWHWWTISISKWRCCQMPNKSAACFAATWWPLKQTNKQIIPNPLCKREAPWSVIGNNFIEVNWLICQFLFVLVIVIVVLTGFKNSLR